MTLVRTHTKTYTRLNAWASTTPADYGDMPRPGDLCAVPRCRQPLRAGEEVYAVTESGGPDAPAPAACTHGPLTTAECGHAHRGQWVCWRHVRGDDGPVGPAVFYVVLGTSADAERWHLKHEVPRSQVVQVFHDDRPLRGLGGPVEVVACESWKHAAPQVREAVLKRLELIRTTSSTP